MRSIATLFAILVAAFLQTLPISAGELQFREQELPTRLTVGYAVRLLDMNEDKRPDIVVVDSKRFLWLENPNWNEHVIYEDNAAQNDNVCFAPADIDGDGRLDFAVGRDWQFGNTESGGTIGWITGGQEPTEPWTYHHIADEPTTHRMQFFDLDKDGREELIVAPLKGRGTTGPNFDESGVRLLSFSIPIDPVSDSWKAEVLNDELRVMHNFWPTDINRDGQLDIITASFEGVSLLERQPNGKSWSRVRIGAGNQQTSPSRGASEIKHGRLANGLDYIATIEPWHGDQVVVYTFPHVAQPDRSPHDYRKMWKRHVLDEDLKWGHAVSCANLDDDDDEELIIGIRDDKSEGARRGLRIYDPQDAKGSVWKRTVVDPGSVAIEDLAAEDLNGDGRIDIVAVGRQTHNVKIYWNETK